MTTDSGKGRRLHGRRAAAVAAVTLGSLVVVLAGLLVGSMIGFMALARTEPVQRALAEALSEALSDPETGLVRVEGLSGTLPHDIAVDRVTVADAQGAWLSVDGLYLRWHPWRLLRGTLDIARIGAESVRLDRLPPSAEDEPATEPAGVPSIPVDLRVRGLAVGRLALSGEVAGEPVALSLQGRLGARTAGQIRSQIELRRLDGPPTVLTGEAAYYIATRQAGIDLVFDEAPGGFVSGLLGLPDRAPLSASLKGEGPVDDWAGVLRADLPGMATVDARVAMALTDDASLTVAGRVVPDAALLGPLAPAVGDAATFTVAVTVPEDRSTLRLDMLQVEGAALAVTGSGTLGLDDLAVAADVGVSLSDGSVLSALDLPVAVDSLALDAVIAGTATRPTIRFDAVARRPAAAGVVEAETLMLAGEVRPETGAAEQAASTEGTADGWRVVLRAALGEATFADAALGLIVGPAPSIDTAAVYAADALIVEHATLRGDAMTAEIAGAVELETGVADVTIAAAVPALGALQPLAGIPIAGRVDLDAHFRATGWGSAVSGFVSAAGAGIGFGGALPEDLVGPAPTLSADVAYSAADGLHLRDLAVDMRGGSVGGAIGLSPDFAELSATLAGTMPDLSFASALAGQPVAGALSFELSASGATADPDLRLTARLADGRAAEIDLAALDLAASARHVASAPEGRVELTGDTSLGPLSASASFARAGDRLRLSDLRVGAAQATVAGGLTVDLAQAVADGTLRLYAPDLAALSPLAGAEVSGAADGVVTLSARGGRQDASAEIGLRNVRMAMPEGAARLESARLSVDGRDLLGQAEGEATLALSALELPQARLATASVRASGGREAVRVALSAEGDAFGPLALDAQAVLRGLAGEAPTAEIESLSGVAAGLDLALEQPATATWSAKGFGLTDLALTVGGGRVAGSASLDGAAIDATLEATDLPIAVAQPFVGEMPVVGTLSLSLRADGTLQSPRGRLRARIDDLRRPIEEGAATRAVTVTPAPEPVAGLALAVDATLADGRAQAAATLEGLPDGQVTASADIPLSLSLQPFAVAVPQGEAMAAEARAEAALAPLWALFGVDGHRISGRATVDAAISGTPAVPQVEASLDMRDGAYENLLLGTVVRDITMVASGTGSEWTLAQLSANDGGSGRLSASGGGGFGGAAGVAGRVEARLDGFRLARRDDLQATTGGALVLVRDAQETAVSGNLNVGPVEARIDGDLPPGVVTLDVVEVDSAAPESAAARGAATAEATPEAAAPAPAVPVSLDINVAMPRQIFVRGRGLDSEWGGALHVGGTVANPVIEGQIKPIRGQFDFAGRVFSLSGGGITFDGGPEIDPGIDVTARYAAEEATAIIQVTGRASSPELSLSSQPEMPQDEILSRVIFGKAMSSLSPFEAIEIAHAAASLSGIGGGGGGILERVRKSLGVDVLRVGGGNGTDGPTVSAGKYVHERVYLGVEQGATAGSSAATVEVEVTDNIVVESKMGADASGNVGVKWKWDY